MKCVKVANTPICIRWQIFSILPIKVKLKRKFIAIIYLQDQKHLLNKEGNINQKKRLNAMKDLLFNHLKAYQHA